MKNNRWILGLVIVVVAIGILSYLGFKRDTLLVGNREIPAWKRAVATNKGTTNHAK